MDYAKNLVRGRTYLIGETIPDFRLFGFHRKPRALFDVMQSDGTIVKECVYEGYADLFSIGGRFAEEPVRFMYLGRR